MGNKSLLVSVLLVSVIAAVAAILVTASWEFSHERIEENQRAKLIENLASVLDAEILEQDLAPVQLQVTDPELLGSEDPIDVFVPVDGTRPLAAVFASIAPDGYNAPIELLIGISIATGRISGVRVIDHRETPGLGDLIEIRKSPWIRQFDGTSLDDPPGSGWAVTQEGGRFDALTGATVTPRAVIGAVHRTLLYFQINRDELLQRAQTEAEQRDP